MQLALTPDGRWDYPTAELVHRELVDEQKILIPIPLESDASAGELFRVVME